MEMHKQKHLRGGKNIYSYKMQAGSTDQFISCMKQFHIFKDNKPIKWNQKKD